MADDDYDDLVAKRRFERESAAHDAERQRVDVQRIRRVYFHRRIALFEAIRKRAAELEERFPHLRQLFVEPFGDSLRMTKSYVPWGAFGMVFDEANCVVTTESKYQDGYSNALELEMRPAPESQETVELWADGRALTDDEIVKMIFDEFIANVA